MGEMEAFFDDGRRFVEIETPAVGYHAAMARRYRQAGRLPVTPSSAESQIQHHRSGCSVVGSKPMKVQATVRAVKRDSYFRRCADWSLAPKADSFAPDPGFLLRRLGTVPRTAVRADSRPAVTAS